MTFGVGLIRANLKPPSRQWKVRKSTKQGGEGGGAPGEGHHRLLLFFSPVYTPKINHHPVEVRYAVLQNAACRVH